jgi:pimeloyl-ACP methyl ester carboxylesterase
VPRFHVQSRRKARHILPASAAVFLVLTLLAGWTAAATAEQAIAGSWQGALKTGGIELRIVFHFAKSADGQLTATMDSPDQGAKDIKIDSVTRDGDRLTLESRIVQGRFEGTLTADGGRLKGQWKQSGLSLPLELVRLEKKPDYRRPQDPVKPYPYREEEVTFENAAAGVKLSGTLSLPKSERPAPAVILLTGSGAQDRDESILGHRPFLVLADHLTRRGIAVLRVDDRGVGGSTGSVSNSTTEDLAGDALAGVALLKRRKEINSRRIGLLGHSEGALVAPLAAARSPEVAFVVLLAGTGVSGDQIVLHQGELIARAEKADEKKIAATRVLQQQLFDIMKREPDNTKAEELLRRAVAESAALADSATAGDKAALESQIAAQTKVMLTPWFRYFISYDPAVALRKVRCPVLVLNGEKDLQVDPKQNLPPIAAALQEAGNRDVTIRELPGLNHLFQHCRTGSPTEYGKIEETMAPEVLELIAAWILERAK